MADKDGSKRTARGDTVDAFAEFYRLLYDSTAKPTQQERRGDDLSPFRGKEFRNKAIRGLRLGNAPDTKSLPAEMLKESTE